MRSAHQLHGRNSVLCRDLSADGELVDAVGSAVHGNRVGYVLNMGNRALPGAEVRKLRLVNVLSTSALADGAWSLLKGQARGGEESQQQTPMPPLLSRSRSTPLFFSTAFSNRENGIEVDI